MPANDSIASSGAPHTRSHSTILWLLLTGMLLALAGNIYQFVKVERLARDFKLMQRNVKNQFADIQELESGALEQNLRRLDGLNKQVEEMMAVTLQAARSDVRRSRADLREALEQKHEDVVKQMSELKSDLSQDTNSKVGRISNNLEETRSEFQRAVNDIGSKSSEGSGNSGEAATTPPAYVPREQAAPAPKKTGLWSRLNPFKRNKKKGESASQ